MNILKKGSDQTRLPVDVRSSATLSKCCLFSFLIFIKCIYRHLLLLEFLSDEREESTDGS